LLHLRLRFCVRARLQLLVGRFLVGADRAVGVGVGVRREIFKVRSLPKFAILACMKRSTLAKCFSFAELITSTSVGLY